jgi:hypothetical protein
MEWDGGDEHSSSGSRQRASLSPFNSPTPNSSQHSVRSQSANRDNTIDFDYRGEEDLWPGFSSVASSQPSSPTLRASSLPHSSAYLGSPQAGGFESGGDDDDLESDSDSVMSDDQEREFDPAPSEGPTRTFHPLINGISFFPPFRSEQMLTCSRLVRETL